ncbi:hypothetical protein COHA_004665 [Chlorella ohadii]|uniref:Uncharacterized protein n=1 Tax=Chlorella ohadii TaxID=2649997 RepID=A0AAD5DPK3_9CHLO|nr:hypothetical protein COHA_004665 [Chlorella ohadii]
MAVGGTIDAYLYGDNLVDSGTPGSMFPTKDRVRFPFRVVDVGPNYINIDRPLPIELRPAWTPVIVPFTSTTSDSGLEHFTARFKWSTYDDHLDAKGYNAIAVYETINCWVRQIKIIDATNGIFMSGNEFITASDIAFSITAERGRGAMATRKVHGHHAMQMANGAYNLQTRLNIGARYYHDLSVDALLHLSVYNDVTGVDINIDNHKAGANSTWWNVYSPSRQLGLPTASGVVDCSVGPLLNWIGPFSSSVVDGMCAATRWTVDNIGAGKTLYPPDLFRAMRSYRNLLPG